MKSKVWAKSYEDRRSFIGGSDARIIMGTDEAALIRLWKEKCGEAEPEDLSGNLVEKRAQGFNARGCQRSDRTRRACQAIESGRGEL
jgi:predicted phage-related endonuclease